jgi:hypothetical protein
MKIQNYIIWLSCIKFKIYCFVYFFVIILLVTTQGSAAFFLEFNNWINIAIYVLGSTAINVPFSFALFNEIKLEIVMWPTLDLNQNTLGSC